MKKFYIVKLSEQERAESHSVIKNLAGSSQKIRRTQMLLKPDQGTGAPGSTVKRIVEAFDARRQTVENVRKRLVAEGFEVGLIGQSRKKPPIVDSEKHLCFNAIQTGEPLAGFATLSSFQQNSTSENNSHDF